MFDVIDGKQRLESIVRFTGNMRGRLRRSLAKLPAPELKIASALHPDVCTIGWPKDQKWTIECKGVPVH